MEIKTEYKSVLNMLDLKIIDSSFHMSEEGIQETELGISFDRKIEKTDTDTYKVLLGITAGNDSKTLFAEAKCLGIFKTSNDNYLLIERNAIAIMFPYLRSYISSLTTQPGMQPIVLPPINIMALLSEQE